MSNFHETGSVRPVMQGAQTVEIPFLETHKNCSSSHKSVEIILDWIQYKYNIRI